MKYAQQYQRLEILPLNPMECGKNYYKNSLRHMDPLIGTKSFRLKFLWSCLQSGTADGCLLRFSCAPRPMSYHGSASVRGTPVRDIGGWWLARRALCPGCSIVSAVPVRC